MAYLMEQGYELKNGDVSFTGASAGAMTAVFSAAGVDFAHATQVVIEMCEKAGVFENIWGLRGVWGSITHQWLDQLLPQNAAQVAEQANVSMLISPVNNLRNPEKIESFSSRDDLIGAIMASVHIPWFLDGQRTRTFRQRKYVDGAIFANKRHYRPSNNEEADVIVLNRFKDPHYAGQSLLATIKVMSPQGVWDMMENGKAYAKSLDEQGRFKKISKVKTEPEEPLVRSSAAVKRRSVSEAVRRSSGAALAEIRPRL